jgi:hypothetical protein
MLRRSLLVSAVLLAGSFGFASSAKAVDQPTIFTGTVSATCNLTPPTTGTTQGVLAPNVAKTQLTTTTQAKVGINCSAGTLRIGVPIPNAATTTLLGTATPTYTSKITTAKGITATNSTGGPAIDGTLTTENGDATVEMTADNSATAFPDGDYGFTVVVTAVP